MVILTETYTFLASALSLFISDKTAAKKRQSLSKIVFIWTSKQPFAIHFSLASYNVRPVAIQEICAQTQEYDYWRLIH